MGKRPRRGLGQRRGAYLLIAAAAAVSMTVPVSAHDSRPPAEPPAPRGAIELRASDALRPMACPFGQTAEVEELGIECASLTLPENRNIPNGRTIELAVAVLHATDATARLDPVVYLEGGPGGSALLNIGLWAGSTLRARHDLVLFDQRGSGYSTPSLACPETQVRGDERWTTDELMTNYRTGYQACHDRLVAAGIDLAAYTTNENAADVEALRLALGVSSWSLYGISYGTRLALEVMRDFPAGVRSVVLDSAYPPQVVGSDTEAANLDRAFDAVLAACAADPACAAAYPGVGQRFGAVVADLELTRFPRPDDVPGHTVTAVFRSWLYDSRQIPLIPALVRSVEIGNVAPFVSAFETRPLVLEHESDGLFLSIECPERFARADPERTAADVSAHPRWAALLERDWRRSGCDIWDLDAAAAQDVTAVHSAIPTLLLSGAFDPVTPPAWADLAASTLTQSTVVHLPGLGHSVSILPCPAQIRDAYLADPSQPPDTGCMDTMFDAAPRFSTEIVPNAGLGRLYQRLLFGLNGPTLGHWMLGVYVLLAFASLAAWWPLRSAWARIRRSRTGITVVGTPRRNPIRSARFVAVAAIVADLVFAIGLGAYLATGPDPALRDLGLPTGLAWLIGVAMAGSLLAVAVGAMAVAAVAARSGRRRERLQLVVVAAACLIFSGTLVHYRVIG